MNNELIILAEQLGTLLTAQKKQLTVAESCTGGWIAQTITAVPGSSQWFDSGLVSYSNACKIRLLGVKEHTLIQHGAVSGETVSEMLTGALVLNPVEYAIAVSGIAGPGGGSEDKPVGTVYIGWIRKDQNACVQHYVFNGDRHEVRYQAVDCALATAYRVFGGIAK